MSRGVEQVALVTGASGTIGRAIALAFARKGARVGVHYHRDEEAARATADMLRPCAGDVALFQADLRCPEEVAAVFAALGERWGCLDVLVNCAGIVADRALIHLDEQDFRNVIAADLLAPLHCIRAALPWMSPGSSIVNIGSIVGIRGARGQCNYSAAKGGLVSLTRSAARTLGPRGITVNAVLPGFHPSRLTEPVGAVALEAARKESVLGCTTSLDELAQFVVFLSRLRTVSGQVFNVDSRVLSSEV